MGESLHSSICILSVLVLVFAAQEDLRSYTIPNACSLVLIGMRGVEIVVLSTAGLKDPMGLVLESVLGSLCILLLLLMVASINLRVGATFGIGGGDIKLLFSLGALLGWKRALLVTGLSGAFGALVGLIADIRKHFQKKKAPTPHKGIPLAPAILLGFLCIAFI